MKNNNLVKKIMRRVRKKYEWESRIIWDYILQESTICSEFEISDSAGEVSEWVREWSLNIISRETNEEEIISVIWSSSHTPVIQVSSGENHSTISSHLIHQQFESH